MLTKLFDEIFGIIGIILGFVLFIVVTGVAYYHYPTTTCIITGILVYCSVVQFLGIPENLATYVLFAVSVGFAFYYFPKTMTVFFVLVALGWLIERYEKTKKKEITPKIILDAFKEGFRRSLK